MDERRKFGGPYKTKADADSELQWLVDRCDPIEIATAKPLVEYVGGSYIITIIRPHE